MWKFWNAQLGVKGTYALYKDAEPETVMPKDHPIYKKYRDRAKAILAGKD